MIVGSCPQMSSLSDRKMRLGGCAVATREKIVVLVTAVARIANIKHRVLSQLSVALSLQFGWD